MKGGSHMRKMHLISRIVSVVGVSTVILISCGDDATNPQPSALYNGQWMMAGMGTTVVNFRSDASFSNITWYSGTVGDTTGGFDAYKGTYSFTPDSIGDQNHGTLHLHYTNSYNSSNDQWVSLSNNDNMICIVNTDSATTTLSLDGTIFQYYGAEAVIPDTL
jgi:hypothetical protein